MTNLVTTLSRYLMILLIAIYTYYNFRFFAMPDQRSRNRLCRLQNVAMFLLHILAGTVIYLRTENEQVVIFFGAQLLFFCAISAAVPPVLPECIAASAE